jgi:hypothetical protein
VPAPSVPPALCSTRTSAITSTYWQDTVRPLDGTRATTSALGCETLLTPTEDQQLLIFTAPPGTATVDHLELPRVVGREQFSPAE